VELQSAKELKSNTRELFMREMSNGWRSYVTYNINPTWEPLNEGPFRAALKALRLEIGCTKGLQSLSDAWYIAISLP
jgi:hypothetical protein